MTSMATLNESVHVVEYNANWPLTFETEQNRLVVNLDLPHEQIVHIGSTAVPGLAAKPIIDIMLGVDAYPPNDSVVKRIAALGYEALGEAGVSGRLYFRRRDAVAINLHIVQQQGPHWVANLALRDYLRVSRIARDRYAAAKRTAIESGATDLLSYSERKADTIAQLVSEAAAFHASKAIQPTR
jgi:GrpB-like predicted nucleotidyltransferase (UPF0157 family)